MHTLLRNNLDISLILDTTDTEMIMMMKIMDTMSMTADHIQGPDHVAGAVVDVKAHVGQEVDQNPQEDPGPKVLEDPEAAVGVLIQENTPENEKIAHIHVLVRALKTKNWSQLCVMPIYLKHHLQQNTDHILAVHLAAIGPNHHTEKVVHVKHGPVIIHPHMKTNIA